MTEDPHLTADEAMFEPREDLDRVQRIATIVGGVGAAVLAAGLLFGLFGDRAQLFRGYLIGWLFCLGVAMGLFAISMLNHVSGGDWGVSLRRVLEASGRTLWLFFVLFLPIAFGGLEEIYPWADPEVVAHDELIAHKAEYLLNKTHFTAYSLAILAAWYVLAYAMSALSRRHDETGDPDCRRNMQRLSAAGLVVYVLTGTLGSVMWIMSVDPHWFSSLFGFLFVAGHGLSAFAFAVPALLFLSRRKPFVDRVAPKTLVKLFHDYGKLMLAFVALWAYFMMSQFLIIWSGNLPEEVTWYLDRASSGWLLISVLLVAGHFVLPFVVLLSQDLKKNARRLVWVAVWLLAMRWFDLYWQVAPSLSRDGVAFGVFELAAPAAIGGVWLALLVKEVKSRALLPVREPALAEVIAHG